MGLDLNGQVGLFSLLRKVAFMTILVGALIAWGSPDLWAGVGLVALGLVTFIYAQIRYRNRLAAYMAETRRGRER
ncbi:MAG TPA: hypothetical protein VIP46_18675 [Pyrinomonadaceae bacterium]